MEGKRDNVGLITGSAERKDCQSPPPIDARLDTVAALRAQVSYLAEMNKGELTGFGRWAQLIRRGPRPEEIEPFWRDAIKVLPDNIRSALTEAKNDRDLRVPESVEGGIEAVRRAVAGCLLTDRQREREGFVLKSAKTYIDALDNKNFERAAEQRLVVTRRQSKNSTGMFIEKVNLPILQTFDELRVAQNAQPLAGFIVGEMFALNIRLPSVGDGQTGPFYQEAVFRSPEFIQALEHVICQKLVKKRTVEVVRLVEYLEQNHLVEPETLFKNKNIQKIVSEQLDVVGVLGSVGRFLHRYNTEKDFTKELQKNGYGDEYSYNAFAKILSYGEYPYEIPESAIKVDSASVQRKPSESKT